MMEQVAPKRPAGVPDDPELQVDLRRSAEFQRAVERQVRRHHPDTLVPALASKLNEVRRDFSNLVATWPPHHLLHAMEASCAYHRYSEPLKRNTLANVINIYHKYHEPAMVDYLERMDDGLHLFIVHVARQQFYLQRQANFHDASRGLMLFDESRYPETVAMMRQRLGFGFREWATFCMAIYARLDSRNPPIIDENYFLNGTVEIVAHDKLSAMFDLLATTQEEVGRRYRVLRQDLRKVLYDPALPSFFVERPLLRLTGGKYVATHVPLIFHRGFEGPYDIARELDFEPFADEFSSAFEHYVGMVLEHLSDVQVFSEMDMRRHTQQKISDYLVVGDDFALFIECKATRYSSIHTSKRAIERDTSTDQIAKGVEQLYSGAEAARDGTLSQLIGDSSGKALLGVVVTFRPIHAVNGDAYWGKVVLPLVTSDDKESWQARLRYRPQVMSVAGLEGLVLVANKNGRSLLDVFEDKLSQPYNLVGDWEAYLGERVEAEDRFPRWVTAYDAFFDNITEPLQQGEKK